MAVYRQPGAKENDERSGHMQCDSGVAALLIEQTLTQDSSTADVLDPAMVWLQAAEDGDSETTTKMLEDEAFTAVNIRFSKDQHERPSSSKHISGIQSGHKSIHAVF